MNRSPDRRQSQRRKPRPAQLALKTSNRDHLIAVDVVSLDNHVAHIDTRTQIGDMEMNGGSPGRTLIDPFGKPLTIDRLPPAITIRWVVRRKVQVVCAIREGLISQRDACDRYGISDAELLSWEKLLDDCLLRVLLETSIQRYRQPAISTHEDARSGSARADIQRSD